MSPTVSQGLILPRCEFEQTCNTGLICGFRSHYWCTDSSTGCKKKSFLHVFLHILCVWVRDRWLKGGSSDLVLYSSLLSFNLSEARTLPQQKERGNDPTQTGSAARWPVAAYREVGMVRSYGCVRVHVCGRRRCFGLCWPTSGPATPLF